jgi:hypothetical protein
MKSRAFLQEENLVPCFQVKLREEVHLQSSHISGHNMFTFPCAVQTSSDAQACLQDLRNIILLTVM